MQTSARSDIADGDIAVELRSVRKVFRQRQRTERVSDVIRNLIQPRYREVRALDDVSLCVARGEIVAYAGPNGAGKSTTIKMLCGMLRPDAGEVYALAMDPARDRARYVSRIGVVFGQRSELWVDQPVSASFDWKRVLWDVPRERYTRMVDFACDRLGVGDFFSTMVRELSLGQRMRADLGLALLHEPEILFLDEPTLGLDVLARRNVLAFIQQLNRERGVTVMVTSHDMADLEQLAGRIVLIDRGRIAFDGDFSRLRREYADRRVLILETETEDAPALDQVMLVASSGGRHEYLFDAARTNIAAILGQAAAQMRLLDVETHRAPIDDLVADVYQAWLDGRQAELR